MRGCISQAFDWLHGNQTSCWARSDNGDELLARAVPFCQRRRWQGLVFLCIITTLLVWTTSLLTGLTNRRTRNRAGGRRQPNSAYEKRRHHQSRESEPVHSFLNAIAQDTPASHSFRIVSQNPTRLSGSNRARGRRRNALYALFSLYTQRIVWTVSNNMRHRLAVSCGNKSLRSFCYCGRS